MQTMRKLFQIWLAVPVFFCVAVLGCVQEKEQPLSGEGQHLQAGGETRIAELLDSMQMHRFDGSSEAPDFELLSVTGEKVSLRQYRGKVVLLSFWATW